jgi:hypothetical protein
MAQERHQEASMRKSVLCSMAVAFFGLAGPCGASDAWEIQQDGDFFTENVLQHGIPQLQHDLQGTGADLDEDWYGIRTKLNHSYEARVSGFYWDNGGCQIPPCPLFARVTFQGNVLTPGVPSGDDTLYYDPGLAKGLAVRWIADSADETGPGGEFLRATGEQGGSTDVRTYDIVFYDTTLFVPRFNNSGTQTTIFILQNTTNETVTGFVYFFDGTGAPLASVALNVVEHGVQVFNTAAIPELAGHSGSATIAQLGGYGAIAGKAVAVEPATGFTFDTAITPLPR